MRTKAGEPKDMIAPCSQSDASQVQRPSCHTRRASSLTPSWPFPPSRLTDRLSRPAVSCAACGRATTPNRSWCEACAAALP